MTLRTRWPHAGRLLALSLTACLAAAPVLAQTGAGCVAGVQSSGALYEICLPAGGPVPGTLVVYAHGFVFPQRPLALPTTEGGVNVREFVTGQGLAYAATSYAANGLVVPESGGDDLRELVAIYRALYDPPDRVLLLGFSNGALIATHTIERHPEDFDGAFASCGPVGSYTREVDYLADLYVVFDHLFPTALDGLFGVEAGGPAGVNPAFLGALASAAAAAGVSPDLFLAGYLQGVLTAPANAPLTGQLLGVIAATPDAAAAYASAAEGVETVIRAVAYNVFATNNVIGVLGGPPYDNTGRTYASPFGAAFDAALNAGIARYAADAAARAQLTAEFETAGALSDPVVALHTTRDGLVPFWQEGLYVAKLSDPSLYALTPIGRYGHCTFTGGEVAAAFDDLRRATGALLTCTTDAPLVIGDVGPARTAVANTSRGEAVDLSACTVAAYGGASERVVAVGVPAETLAPAATAQVGLAAPPGPGAVVVSSAPLAVGSTVGDALGSIVAAVVYGASGEVYVAPDGTRGECGNGPAVRPCGSAEGGEALATALAALFGGATAGEEDPHAERGLAVWPNPTAATAEVAVWLAEPGEVRLSVHDALGREVAVLADGPYGPGRADAVLDASALPAGVYVVRAVAGGEVRAARVTVAR